MRPIKKLTAAVAFGVSSATAAPLLVDDTFETLDTIGTWEIVSGSWSVSGGQLTGSWGSDPQSSHANLLLRRQDLQADYHASFTAALGSGGPNGFSLFNGLGDKYNINLAFNGVSVERRLGGSPYVSVGMALFNHVTLGSSSTVELDRTGDLFTVTVDGIEALQFQDTVWGGDLRTGLRAYSTAVYDHFSFQGQAYDGPEPAPNPGVPEAVPDSGMTVFLLMLAFAGLVRVRGGNTEGGRSGESAW